MTSEQLQKPLGEIATAHPEVEFALVPARTIDSDRTDPSSCEARFTSWRGRSYRSNSRTRTRRRPGG